jgi:hypothetical protein
LYNTAVIEYHGEIDPQKQAGDMMERAMAEEGMRLLRIEGPQTPHRYHPDSKVEIARLLDAIAERGRDPYPRKIHFTTWTLTYNRMKWVTIDALAKHWERARLNAEIAGGSDVRVESSNVAAFTLEMGPGGCALEQGHQVAVAIDGQKVVVPGPMSDRSWIARLQQSGGKWRLAQAPDDASLRKRHGLQGPVDDAFLDSFLFVSPTGAPLSAPVGKWVESEEKRAIDQWRRQFRGEAPVKQDREITDADIAANNLILWGDPSSNHVVARIAGKLPVQWSAAGVVLGAQRFDAATHAPVLIFPNPLNPHRYVVLNSGFTFREGDWSSNSRQTPKLPDYAVVDTRTPPDGRFPGKIVAAGFFNENWGL